MTNNFQQKLKQGENFEIEIAQPFLIDKFPEMWITPCHNYQVRAGFAGGPRMHKAKTKPVVLPDFELSSDGSVENMLIEAKWKNNPFTLGSLQYFSIESYKCADYEIAASAKNASLWYLIGCEHNRTLYMYSNEDYIMHTFNNTYTKNRPVPNRCFLKCEKHEVGKF